jgi:plastocyanin
MMVPRLAIPLVICCAQAAIVMTASRLPVVSDFSRTLQVQSAGPLGSIRGHVEVRRSVPPVEARPSVGEFGMPNPHDQPDRMTSVLYLESAAAGALDDRLGGPSAAAPVPPRGRARMTQRNETFVPHVLAVRVGTTVDFPNEDHTYHNVFSLSKTQRFDLGRYAAGQSKPVRFDRPGIVRVFCDIHSHMSAFTLVFSHRFFDTTDAEGRYEIRGIPPGKYTVVAWNDGAVRDSRPVVVPQQGGAIEQDFVIR